LKANHVIDQLTVIAEGFAAARSERHTRRYLDPEDFNLLAEAGYLNAGLADDCGGLWRNLPESIRDYCRMIKTLAHGDPSVALVSAMHPAVLIYWMHCREVEDAPDAWQQQRNAVAEHVRGGNWWGTVTSEPGSGGDIMKTKSLAEIQPDGEYLLTGDKHFGSGSGQTSFMMTTAKASQDDPPAIYILDVRGAPIDGSTGCTMTTEWDGMGMTATQSHAFHFEKFPASRIASMEAMIKTGSIASALGNGMFMSVTVAIVEDAISMAKDKLGARADSMRSFEKVEWTRCVNEMWTIQQVYQGAISAVENQEGALPMARAKVVIAELAETCLSRLSRVVGGASYARGMPFAQWSQDVRALGFLRPPLPLAYDQLFDASFRN